jgi:serine/threonine protein phosphatase 1
MGRIFAIGDIHGHHEKISSLLEKLPVRHGQDRLVFLGDYVDRGPESRKVLDLMVDLHEKYPSSTVFLKGNHEAMFLDYIENGPLAASFLSLGGIETIKSYGVEDLHLDIPKKHLAFLKGLETMLVTERYCFVHAGLRPGVPIEKQEEEDILWIRFKFIKSGYDWGKRVIFGHTPFDTPLIEKNKIGIDTGAAYGGRLTCLVLPDMEFIFA